MQNFLPLAKEFELFIQLLFAPKVQICSVFFAVLFLLFALF